MLFFHGGAGTGHSKPFMNQDQFLDGGIYLLVQQTLPVL
jgi:hypothetical protein